MNEADGTTDALIQFMYRAPIGMLQTAADGTIEILNPAAAQLLMPLSCDGALDNLFELLEVHAPELRDLAGACTAASGIVCDALRIALPLGIVGNASERTLSLNLLKLDEGRLIATLADVSRQIVRERGGLARRHDDAPRFDGLTQLPNRSAICEYIQSAIDRKPEAAPREFAVLFLNCDRFKQINDALGHAFGDEVLGLMADRLRSVLRARDGVARTHGGLQIAARVSGDEFVVLLDNLRRAEDVHPIARRLVDQLTEPYGVGEHQVHCSVSVGVVLRAQAPGDADGLIQKASIAMIEAKRSGGGRYVVFEPCMLERASRRSSIEVDLRRALAENQLFVVYQPIVRLTADGAADGSAGVEALVRWQHPTRGSIPPLEFISVAEECGLIGAIGDFVLATACEQFVAWQRELGARMAPQMLAVNLSRAQLLQPRLVRHVRQILEASGMRSRQLQLEVTESLAAQDERVQRCLHELKELRLTLALDDFGTGYSSLASLHQLPIDTVKIDRSFVSQADTSYHHRVLIEATVRVAMSLGMSTVAEGIETRSQATVVQKLGCEKGQGFLFSKPLAARALAEWLAVREPGPR